MRGSRVLSLTFATLAGCGGSDSSTQDTGARAPAPATTAAAPASDVASHVGGPDRFLGSRKLAGFADQVRTDPATFVSDAPFLYSTPDDAVQTCRRTASWPASSGSSRR